MWCYEGNLFTTPELYECFKERGGNGSKSVDPKRLEYIQGMRSRIESEYTKHSALDWPNIAAIKLYASYIFPVHKKIESNEACIDGLWDRVYQLEETIKQKTVKHENTTTSIS